MQVYDVTIIGGGISGLYSAFQIKKMAPKTSILILEKNDEIGGRMDIYDFYNNPVNTGAGVGRKRKDFVLIDLLDELNIKYKEFPFHVSYSDKINKDINVNKLIKLLNNKYTKKHHKSTFKEFGNQILGEKYKDFVTKIGFSDFEKEDAYDVLNYYGLDDNEDGWIALKIDWALLIKKISEKIGLKNICVKNQVNNISKTDDLFVVDTSKKSYFSKKIIIATTIETVSKLLPNLRIYNQVHGQVFLRVYAKFSNPIPNLENYTIVTGPLKKIIPINIKDGVYMIAYTDNKDAISLKKYTKNNLQNREYFCKLVEKALSIKNLHIKAIKSFYWEIGTHYYDPLKEPFTSRREFIKQAQHPYDNILVVGEMISENQGWTNGALESVNSVVNLEWIKS
jgi:hypothetical protein